MTTHHTFNAGSSNQSMKTWLGRKFFITIVGLIIIGIAHLLPMLLNHLEGMTPEESLWIGVINWSRENTRNLYQIGIVNTGLGIFLYAIHYLMTQFWGSYINPHITSLINDLSDTLEQSKINAKEIIEANSLQAAISHSEPSAVRQILRQAHAKVYGSHCDKPKGLYLAMQQKIGKYLSARVPHRSTNHQNIVISSAENGRFLWREKTTYNLHTIEFDDDFIVPSSQKLKNRPPVKHMFTTSTSAKYADLANVLLEIEVDGQVIASTAGVFKSLDRADIPKKFNISTGGEIEIKKVNDEYQITISKEIDIKKAETKVKITETSIMEENFFVSRRDQPVCGQTVTIQIPDGYVFDYFVVPPDVESPEQVTQNHRTIKIEGWSMPGILLSCQWSRSPEQLP